MASTSPKTWLGSSITDLCRGKGPWSYAINPVNASKYHHVLYTLPANLREPPAPYIGSQANHWSDDHVKMPYSEKNLFPVVENETDVIKSRWDIIKQALTKQIKSCKELEAVIQSYNSPLPKFGALHYIFDEVFNEDETNYFFEEVLPEIIKLALDLPEILPQGIPLLQQNHNRSLSLSQLQIACILANGFLCTFPWAKGTASSYPGVNFVRLFSAYLRPKRQQAVTEKLKCLLNYFRRVVQKKPIGVVTFERKFIPRSCMPRWDTVENNLGNTKIHITSTGTIEDGLGFLQVDFANKNVGGGVLGYGCVQEEIRFVLCPELIASRLFVEQLGNNEAVIVTGVERYGDYTGYGDTFKWESNVNDTVPFDEYGRRRTSVCIIDAIRFNKPQDQFHCSSILRELNKAYVGFSTRQKENIAPVATGNWGCGAFKGSKKLKSLIQLMACSAANRDVVYYSFGDTTLMEELYNMHLFLASNKISIAQLWKILCQFTATDLKEDSLYAFIQQAYFDSKRQPSVKQFFMNTKLENNSPSTSVKEKTVTKVEFNKKESKNDSRSSSSNTLSEDLENVDFIPSSQPEVDYINSNKMAAKIKKSEDSSLFATKIQKKSDKDILKKLPKTNIAELIDIIDGNHNAENSEQEHLSLLQELDKIKNVKGCSTTTEVVDIQDLFEENMEIDEHANNTAVEPVKVQNVTSSNSSAKVSKRKISDYFIKSGK